MSNTRRAKANLTFNGANMSEPLKEYLSEATYTDECKGSCDSLELILQNIDMSWLRNKYPEKGDAIAGTFEFENWTKFGDNSILDIGTFVLDSIQFQGGPLEARFGALSVPADSSFMTRERTKTWQDVTLAGIAGAIAGSYVGLGMHYEGPIIQIKALEQTQRTDSAFLYELCETYGMGMKVFKGRIDIFDPGRLEAAGPVCDITRDDFLGDGWKYEDCLQGVYTGARVSYKRPDKNDEEISVFVGLVGEDAPGSRVLKINETADDEGDALRKAKAAVNKSNETMTTISGDIFYNAAVCAGATVNLKDFGVPDGKYLVDKCTTRLGGSGTIQTIEAHKCQTRL